MERNLHLLAEFVKLVYWKEALNGGGLVACHYCHISTVICRKIDKRRRALNYYVFFVSRNGSNENHPKLRGRGFIY